MNEKYTAEGYESLISALFHRFPSFQKDGASAYKPGIGNIIAFDSIASHPHKNYKTIHIAGTNGKGSVSSFLASTLAACGFRTGLYTSPHILDFRERMRIVEPSGSCRMISKEDVWNFVTQWQETFDHLDLSFFEITTCMAFNWFATQKVDVAVIETGLGGRLDSTNIITPVLSVITNIGLDHCDMLGNTIGEIAFEKAGIIKPCIPAVVGESGEESSLVFERKVLYSNISETQFMGDRNRIMGLLTFADKTEPHLWDRHEEILGKMDLKGSYQVKNLRTALAAIGVLSGIEGFGCLKGKDEEIVDAIEHTARRTEFHGRWEKVHTAPDIICDIGHNAHGLKDNFANLSRLLQEKTYDSLTIIYGVMADKDTSDIFPMMPKGVEYVFTAAAGPRALGAEALKERFISEGWDEGNETVCFKTVPEAVGYALEKAAARTAEGGRHLIYIGGSTYVVSEAVSFLK